MSISSYLQRNSLFWGIAFVIITASLGCKRFQNNVTPFDTFPLTLALNGIPVPISDSISRVLGKADVCDSSYVYYIYQSPFFLSTSDKNFKAFKDFGMKGEGPGELSGATLAGYDPVSHLYRIHDYNTQKIFTASIDSNLMLREETRFPESFARFDPIRVIRLADGTYVGARGDFRYGLVSFNPIDGSVREWPVGEGFNTSNPDTEEIFMRSVQYNPAKGIVAEIYGRRPDLLLHREDGNLLAQFRYAAYDRYKKPDGATVNCFHDLVLSDRYIWLLYGDQDVQDDSRVFCLDYEGNPVAELIIDSTSTIAIDERERKLLAIDPNDDEKNLVVYQLPDLLYDTGRCR